MTAYPVRYLLLTALAAVPIRVCATQTVAPAGPHDGYIASTGGVRLYYRVMGGGPDTLIMIHGGPGAGMNAIIPDFKPLAAHHTLIFYDQRGGGRSTLPADTTLLDARYFVDDLDAVRRHFGLDRVALLAHSFGPLIAALYAQTHPEHVARMIFIGAIGPRRDEARAWWNERQRQMGTADTALTRRARALDSTLITGNEPDPVATCHERDRVGQALAVAQRDTIRWHGTVCDASPEAITYFFHYTSQLTPESLGAWLFYDVPAPRDRAVACGLWRQGHVAHRIAARVGGGRPKRRARRLARNRSRPKRSAGAFLPLGGQLPARRMGRREVACELSPF